VSRDLYNVLGIPGTASEAEIRHAFWALAKRYHPDVNGGDPDAARRFLEVANAAETLLDPRRRASYDESRAPGAPARPPGAAPKPPTPKPPAPPGTARAARTTPPAASTPVSQRPGGWLDSPVNAIAVLAVIAVTAGLIVWGVVHSPKKKDASGMPVNGTVVWKAAGFGLDDGWGINLAGDGTRIQIVPGTSTDIEVADGYLASAGHITMLPHGEALTYQHCVSAVQQATSQSEPLSEIAPASRRGLCVSGSGGDLASVQVTHDDGSSLTVNITVWEYV
jgi:DnaJ domain